jgi:hypothetical protein
MIVQPIVWFIWTSLSWIFPYAPFLGCRNSINLKEFSDIKWILFQTENEFYKEKSENGEKMGNLNNICFETSVKTQSNSSNKMVTQFKDILFRHKTQCTWFNRHIFFQFKNHYLYNVSSLLLSTYNSQFINKCIHKGKWNPRRTPENTMYGRLSMFESVHHHEIKSCLSQPNNTAYNYIQ